MPILKKKIPLLRQEEYPAIIRACQFNAGLMDHLRPLVQAGITTGEIDQKAHQYTVQAGHLPAPLNYRGFPKSCCISVNEVVCHGIPGEYVLKEGDIVNVDVTTIVDGWYGDQSETFLVGEVASEAKKIVQCAFDALHLAIDTLSPGDPVSQIGKTIVSHAQKFGFGVVQEYIGHGIGKAFHQLPNIPHYPTPQGEKNFLLPGTCFTIEPMINGGSRKTVVDESDNWTVRTLDGSLSAQFEHTILMTNKGPKILTETKHGPKRGDLF